MHDVCYPLQELSCSLRKTNPGVSLTIMAVEGDLSSSTQLEVKKHGNLLLVDDIKFANFKLDGRSAATEHILQHLFYSGSVLSIMFRLSMIDTKLSSGHGLCFGIF